MAIIKSFNGASLRVPGAYSKQRVNLIGTLPLTGVGIVGIVGEASKGEPGSSAGAVLYDSTQLNDLVDNFGSGPIVDAARALVNPSNDARITNGASQIYVYKTNASTKSTLTINRDTSTTWGVLSSKNYGVGENQISADIDTDTTESFSIVLDAYVTQPGNDLDFRVNGGAVNTFTAASMSNIGNATTEINTQLDTAFGTSGVTYATNDGTAITINLFASGHDSARHGMSASIEFITDGQYADIGVPVAMQGVPLVAGTNVSGVTAVAPTRSITVARQSDDISETTADTTGEVGGKAYLKIGCNAATTATLTISSTTLSTSVAGAGASNLSITLADYDTLNDLADFIEAQTGYSCSVNTAINGSLPPSVLDRVSAVGICASATGIEVGHVKADSYEIQNWFDLNCSLAALVRNTTNGFLGFPDAIAKTFFASGTLGASTTANFNSGFIAFESKRINTVIPLVSQDATDDQAEDEGYTDSSSTYDVESIHTQAREHCKKMSNTVNRSERNAYIGYRGTFQEVKDQANAVASEFASICLQDVQVLNSSGVLTYMQPHIAACIIAGLQAGSEVGEPATFKFAAINAIKHVKKQGATPSAAELFDSAVVGDKNQAIDNGILPFEAPANGGVRVVLQNSTYQKDANFVFNRPSVLESAHYVAYNLRVQLEEIFVGTKAKTGSAQTIRNATIAIMQQFLDADITVGDDTNGGLGYKNLAVVVSGNTASITMTITPVQGIDFVLLDLTLDNITQTA